MIAKGHRKKRRMTVFFRNISKYGDITEDRYNLLLAEITALDMLIKREADESTPQGIAQTNRPKIWYRYAKEGCQFSQEELQCSFLPISGNDKDRENQAREFMYDMYWRLKVPSYKEYVLDRTRMFDWTDYYLSH
jgi:hypothetical protein